MCAHDTGLEEEVVFREKCYVEVVARFNKVGVLTPLKIIWDDGRAFTVDKVLDRHFGAAMKVGGQGICYVVKVANKERKLWQDERGWFVERIVKEESA